MSRKLHTLTTQDLENILGECEDSEDGLDFSDDDDVADPTYNFEPNEHASSDEDPEVPPDLENEVQSTSILVTSTNTHIISTAMDPSLASASTSASSAAAPRISNRVPMTMNITWKTKTLNINEDELRFLGSEKLPLEILCLDTPFEIFSYLFTEEIINFIRDQTNLYSVQKEVGNCNGVDVAVVAWRDNKIVTLASNFAGKHPTSVVRRYGYV
ncbi:unnamed protein product [Parnassius apollo]|uniref:(apollo) hypothetical protein n=1 Tax=Parnassius apollo TaxID=110799 RepID=A0A8S3X6U2_PARAO|nr:unnamed protein product [Parnassius apollo]